MERVSSFCMTDSSDKSWQEESAVAIGRRVHEIRVKANLGAQEVANKCTNELGFKMLRTTLVNLERGVRKSVTIHELVVLGEALGVSPLLLLYPLEQPDKVEYVPGQQLSPWEAARRFSAPMVEALSKEPRVEITSELDEVDPGQAMTDLVLLEKAHGTWEPYEQLANSTRFSDQVRQPARMGAAGAIHDILPIYKRLIESGVNLSGQDPAWIDALEKARRVDDESWSDDAFTEVTGEEIRAEVDELDKRGDDA